MLRRQNKFMAVPERDAPALDQGIFPGDVSLRLKHTVTFYDCGGVEGHADLTG